MNKKQEYNRLATIPLWNGLIWIESQIHMGEKDKRVEIAGHMVHVTSLRLRTFYFKGTTCCRCGLKASFFSIEHQTRNDCKWPHMNLYGINDLSEEVIFTKDHIKTRKEGGRDILSNLQTMCKPCNATKGSISDLS